MNLDEWNRHCRQGVAQGDTGVRVSSRINDDKTDTLLASVLKPGARLRFATDVRSYADEALCRFLDHPAYTWQAKQADDWRLPPSDHITTRYQEKKLGDIEPVYYDFRIDMKS